MSLDLKPISPSTLALLKYTIILPAFLKDVNNKLIENGLVIHILLRLMINV